MTNSSNGLLRSLALVACGGAVGGIAGWLASDLAQEPTDDVAVRQLLERVTEVERRVPAENARDVRRRDRVAPRTESEGRAAADGAQAGTAAFGGGSTIVDRALRASRSGEGDSAAESDNGDGAVPRAPPPEFVDLVRAAIGEIKRQDAEGSVDKRVADQRKKYAYEVDKKLHNYREQLGLTDEQVTAFREAAVAGYDERLAAQLDGRPKGELEALDRTRHRAFRDVMGGAAYREFRKLELDAVARPTIVSIAGQAGVDREQRDRIERLLDNHIEGLVDLDVKLRTEELGDEERRAIHERMQSANRSAWDTLRGSILDAEQRERVPKRLR